MSSTPSAVIRSDDGGATWQPAGDAFPGDGVGRIGLALRPSDPNLIYAFAAKSNGAVRGLFRLDDPAGKWKPVSGLPGVLPTDDSGGSQGAYDLAIAVDPADPDLVYLGGSYADVDPYPGSIWRCPIVVVGGALGVKDPASIGTRAHADVHMLIHTPDTQNELWCTCDGGVFLNRDPRSNGEFASQNNGLACLCTNFIAQHPTDPNIVFTGMQDNGTARTASGPVWTHVGGGDGGYCVVNWADPEKVLIYQNGAVLRSTTGGTTEDGWTPVWSFGWFTMTQPIVAAPYEPDKPSNADVVAIGAGPSVYVSTDFASTWPANGQIQLPDGASGGDVFALAFASADRLFAATTVGQVFRADRASEGWTITRLDNVAGAPLGLTGLIDDIAVDWSDSSLSSVFVAFGGRGDPRRVWRFDGTGWEARSGTPGQSQLLDVEHNVIVVDRKAPTNVYAGADIGVWHSPELPGRIGSRWKTDCQMRPCSIFKFTRPSACCVHQRMGEVSMNFRSAK